MARSFIFAEKQWREIAEKLASNGFGNADSCSFNRVMLAHAFETDVDAKDASSFQTHSKKQQGLLRKLFSPACTHVLKCGTRHAGKTIQRKLGEADALAGKLRTLASK